MFLSGFRTFRVFEQLLASELSPAMAIDAFVHPTAAFIDRSSLIATNYRFLVKTKKKQSESCQRQRMPGADRREIVVQFIANRSDTDRIFFFQACDI